MNDNERVLLSIAMAIGIVTCLAFFITPTLLISHQECKEKGGVMIKSSDDYVCAKLQLIPIGE